MWWTWAPLVDSATRLAAVGLPSCDIDHQEAVELANRIEAETGLSARVIDEGDDDLRVDIDAPLLPGESRATVSAYDHQDWPWLYEQYIRSRLNPPPQV